MPTTINDLVQWVEQRVENDPTLDDEVGLLVLAALEGDSELDAYLESGANHVRAAEHAAADDVGECATGAFLRSLSVTGFRGIGSPVTLTLDPTPGLIVVAGRNGSGKSSIAEGFEVLLTGGTYRWKKKRSTQWAERWKNMHREGQPEIDAEVIEQGSGPILFQTRWDAGATDVAHHRTTAQRTIGGTKGPAQPISTLGWRAALEAYRPMLSYDELGGLLEAGPSELYDALAKMLGLEQLADALARMKTRLARLSEPQKKATADRRTFQLSAGSLDDERAQAVASLLNKTSPDTSAIRELATGVILPDQGIVASLRAVAQVDSPDPARITATAQRLRAAVTAMAAAGEAEAARRVARLELRRQSLQLHADHGEQTCPVCNQGYLDDAWARTSQDLVAHEEVQLQELSDAKSNLETTRRALRALAQKRPPALDRSPTDLLDTFVTAAREAWDDFESFPEGDLALADHLELHAEHLASALGEVRAAAAAELAERDNAWAPLAARIAAWCEVWDDWLKRKRVVDRLAAAEKWLKQNDISLKNERIAPISHAARHAWALLRQESNVELGELRLEGQANRRRVSITATVDGEDAGNALPVMSQGELHALALALFLPRATLDESPFRFVILDDPIQAMDPAKVDGLVALLSEIAESRQVIVFSHDDRLPAALRRANRSARIFEVTRGPNSRVTIETAEDPTTRYLDDARALCKDSNVPSETLRRTLPGLLRLAIESAARDRFFAARLSRGHSLGDVETTWNAAQGTSQRVSLAVYDEVKPLDGWLRTEARKKGLGIATSGFHNSMHSGIDPADAVYHARRMVDDIQAAAK